MARGETEHLCGGWQYITTDRNRAGAPRNSLLIKIVHVMKAMSGGQATCSAVSNIHPKSEQNGAFKNLMSLYAAVVVLAAILTRH